MSKLHFTAKTDLGQFAGRGRIDSLGRIYWDEKENIDELCKAGMKQLIFEIPARRPAPKDTSDK